jgi:hypothetical protein
MDAAIRTLADLSMTVSAWPSVSAVRRRTVIRSTLHGALALTLLALAACGGGNTSPSVVKGSLQVSVTGLPNGVNASVTVTGPEGFSRSLTASNTLGSLTPGTYTIAAASVTGGCGKYDPAPPTQTVSVPASTTATTATVAYSIANTVLGQVDLSICAVEIVQSVQRIDNSIPLVKGKDAYLRVFAMADQTNTAAPSVRVRIYQGGNLASPTKTLTIAPPGVSTPTGVDESSLGKSWNILIPGTDVQPGMALLVDVNPDGSVAEANPQNDSWPLNGTPVALDVRDLPPLGVTFVPVKDPSTGLVGRVDGSNASGFVDIALKLHPLASVSTSVHAVVTASQGPFQSGNGNDAWTNILSQIDQVRVAEGASHPATQHYFGVLQVSYNSGVAGLAYVSSPPQLIEYAAVGWDYSSNRDAVFAHEIGHNWGRSHSPCGNPLPSGLDPAYPYAGGQTGSYGIDLSVTQSPTLKQPTSTDIMGYCSNQWISDYTYLGELNYRGSASADVASPDIVGSAAEPTLMVSGTMDERGVRLNPAFEVTTLRTLPSQGGPYAIEGFDASGARLFSVPFAPRRIADAGHDVSQFTFAIPAAMAHTDKLASLKVSGPSGAAELRQARPSFVQGQAPVTRPAGPPAAAAAGRAVGVTWDGAAYPAALIRDARTGEVLAIGSGGKAEVETEARDLDVVFSDGVRSHAQRLSVAGR